MGFAMDDYRTQPCSALECMYGGVLGNRDKTRKVLYDMFWNLGVLSDTKSGHPKNGAKQHEKESIVMSMITINKKLKHPFPIHGCFVDYLEWGGGARAPENDIPHLSAKLAQAILEEDYDTACELREQIEPLKVQISASRDEIMR